MPKNIQNLFKPKKLPILAGIILGIFVAIIIFGAVINSFSGGEAIKVVSAQNVYNSSENPQFIFAYRKQTNIFNKILAAVSDLFSSESEEIATSVRILDSEGKEVDTLNPQIKEESKGKFSVNLDHSRFQQELKPGKYEIEMEIIDGENTYIQKQEFRWGVLAINTNKSIYLPNEEAYLQIASLDDMGRTLCDSMMELVITTPKGKKIPLEIEKSGKCGPDNVVDVPDYFARYRTNEIGKYKMVLTNIGNDYSITDYFEVRSSVEFDVERIGPTRIWPEADYDMKIKIKANQDFEGEIIEMVPMLFAITENTGAVIDSLGDNYTKTIIWQVKIKKGETKELSYTIDFPNVSPYFYLLGPLELRTSNLEPRTSNTDTSNPEPRTSNTDTPNLEPRTSNIVFQETRMWQIASDYTCGIGSSIGGGQCRYFVTTSGSGVFTVPWDWTDVNTVVVIGGGGNGSDLGNSTGGGGGGGGAYASVSNITGLTAGGTVQYQRAPTMTNDNDPGYESWFGSSASASAYVYAQGGRNGNGATGGAGGSVIIGTGFSGGNGGNGGGGGDGGGGGGGGAAGPDGAGKNGGSTGYDGGAGGGGAGGGVSTDGLSTTVENTGVQGGTGPTGTAGGTTGSPGNDGSQGSGGGGATDTTPAPSEYGGDGGAGIEWTTYGAGGGGGGAADGGYGGAGGNSGGGGGGCGEDGDDGGTGASGLIGITYTQVTLSISGTCKQYDETTNSTEAAVIKVAINTTVESNTASCSAGSWSLNVSTAIATNDKITVWVDGVADSNEAVALTEWDGSGHITGVALYERHLTIGSNNANAVSVADASTYDNSVSGDEDIFFEASTTSLEVCRVSGCESAELYIVSGNTFQPNAGGSSYVETHDIEIDGTFDMTGTNNYASVSGNWDCDSTFTAGTSSIYMVASDSTQTIGGDSFDLFYTLKLGDSATTSYTGHFDLGANLDVNNDLTIDAGTLDNSSGNYTVNLAGNLSLAGNGSYTKGGTFTFDGASKTWTDSSSAKSDMGAVVIDGASTLSLGSSVRATTLNITTGDTLNFNNSNTLYLTGSGTPLTNSGTFTASTGTVVYEGTSATTITALNGLTPYYNLTAGKASDNNTVLFTAGGEIAASGSITVANGGIGTHTFDQSTYDVSATGGVAVEANAQWRNVGTGDLTLGGNFANAGSVSFSTSDVECTGDGTTDDIAISSNTTDLRTWSGVGTFNLYNITASYQADSSRTCTSCTNSGSTSTWTFSACAAGAPTVSQAHFRWRNDNGNETTATWKRSEDIQHSGQALSENARLRFSIKNSGTATATSYEYELQVASKSGYSTCEVVPSASYSVVPTTTAGCGSSVACMTTSTNFTDGDATTNQLTSEGTFTAGDMVEDPSNITGAISIDASYFTEAEYNFQFTSIAAYGANYCFRVTNNGALLDTYTKVADIAIEGSGTGEGLITRIKGSTRILGGTRIGSHTGSDCDSPLIDSRDSKSYTTVLIGTQCWMAQGLNVGTRINYDTNQDGYSGTTCTSIDKYCAYNLDIYCDSVNNPTYPDGGLYQWNQAMCGSTTEGVQGICPDGWHIPTDAEWYALESYLWTTGTCVSDRTTWGCEPAGTSLKSGGSSGFEGNLAAYVDQSSNLQAEGSLGIFWTSKISGEWIVIRSLGVSSATVLRSLDAGGYTVRCIKD